MTTPTPTIEQAIVDAGLDYPVLACGIEREFKDLVAYDHQVFSTIECVKKFAETTSPLMNHPCINAPAKRTVVNTDFVKFVSDLYATYQCVNMRLIHLALQMPENDPTLKEFCETRKDSNAAKKEP